MNPRPIPRPAPLASLFAANPLQAPRAVAIEIERIPPTSPVSNDGSNSLFGFEFAIEKTGRTAKLLFRIKNTRLPARPSPRCDTQALHSLILIRKC